MIKIILLLICLSSFFQSNSQTKALKIGDVIPHREFAGLLDHPDLTLKTTDYRGKLLILDFWNIRCSACITGFPKMDSLQKIFADKLQIISVTKNTQQEVSKLFGRIKTRKPDFPFVVGDSIWNELLTHSGDPLHVWIDSNGVVLAITQDHNTNEKTVNQYLSGAFQPLPRRWDYGVNDDYDLISEANSGAFNYMTHYSVLFKNLQEITYSGMIRDDGNKITVIGIPLLTLYKTAYKKELYGQHANMIDMLRPRPELDRTQLLVKDKEIFIRPTDEKQWGDWEARNLYSYEIKVPKERSAYIYEYMREDLRRYFPYSVKIGKQRVNGLALRKIPIPKKNVSIGAFSDTVRRFKTNFSKQPIGDLITYLNSALSLKNLTVANETGITGNIDLTIYFSDNIDILNDQLKYYGLSLVKNEIEISTLIIKDVE